MSSSSSSAILQKGGVVVGSGADGVTEDEYKTWKCLYPNYIDKSKSVKEGRRITSCKAVDRPSLGEIVEVLQMMRVPYVVENKAYSRDWMVRGRVRVNLEAVTDQSINTSTSHFVPLFPTASLEMKLMCKLGSEIPKLKSHMDRLAKEAAAIKALEAKAAKEAAASAQPSSSSKKAGKAGKRK